MPIAGFGVPILGRGRRVKGVKKHGMRMGNWVTAEQGKRLFAGFDQSSIRGKRDYAMVAILLGCGLRRAEVAGLAFESLQQREEHWVIADMVGKGGHVRTVPVPTWVKAAVDTWLSAAGVTTGPIFRAINKAQRIGADPAQKSSGACLRPMLAMRSGQCCPPRPSPHAWTCGD